MSRDRKPEQRLDVFLEQGAWSLLAPSEQQLVQLLEDYAAGRHSLPELDLRLHGLRAARRAFRIADRPMRPLDAQGPPLDAERGKTDQR